MSITLRSDPDEDAINLYGTPSNDPLFGEPKQAGQSADSEKTAPPDPVVWQNELVELLASIEHVRWRMRGLKPLAGGPNLLSFAEASLQACEGLAQDTKFAKQTAEAQTEAVAKAGTFITRLAQLRPAAHGGLLRSVFSAFAPDAAPLDPVAVQECLLSHHEAISAYFALFTDHFQSSQSARGWVSAAGCFLADYKAMIRDLA